MFEKVLRDWAQAEGVRRATALCYFNPVGAHPSPSMGEDLRGALNNLMPYIS